MKNTLLILKTEIEKELKDLERLRDEMSEVLNHADPSFMETRAAGSILHDFYSGIERTIGGIPEVSPSFQEYLWA